MPTRWDDRGLRAELTLMWAVVGLCAILFLLGLRATAPRPQPAVAKTSGTTSPRPPHHGAGYWKHRPKRRRAQDDSGDDGAN